MSVCCTYLHESIAHRLRSCSTLHRLSTCHHTIAYYHACPALAIDHYCTLVAQSRHRLDNRRHLGYFHVPSRHCDDLGIRSDYSVDNCCSRHDRFDRNDYDYHCDSNHLRRKEMKLNIVEIRYMPTSQLLSAYVDESSN